MKKIIPFFILLALAGVSLATDTVTVNTNGVVVAPTNFFTINIAGLTSGSRTNAGVTNVTYTFILPNITNGLPSGALWNSNGVVALRP